MKKTQKKNQNKIRSTNYRKALLIALVVFVSFIGLYYYNYRIEPAVTQAGISQTRELIIMAAEATKKDAPIEAKTGDVYFPEAKFYIPNPGGLSALTYSYYQDNQTSEEAEFSITNSRLFGFASKLYSANNMEELFSMVPELQACQRGITLRYTKLTNNDLNDSTISVDAITLNNSKMLYLYKDKACNGPEIDSTIDIVKTIRAY